MEIRIFEDFIGNQGHQGDVFFEKISDSLEPTNGLEALSRDDTGTLTIVKGEKTHHHHLFSKEADVDAYFIGEADGIRMFEVIIKNPTEFTHLDVKTGEWAKEHYSIKLPAGKYRFGTQREFRNGQIFPIAD
jgi:hypothetical protein